MAEEGRWNKLLQKRWLTLVGLVLGIVFLLWGSSSKPQNNETAYTVQYYSDRLEERITELCNSIGGVQDATVLLTLESGSEFVYAQNTNESSSGGAWDYVILQQGDGETGILVKEIYPQIRGVAIVCTGGDTAAVQEKIIELLSASLGIATHRIRVVGR